MKNVIVLGNGLVGAVMALDMAQRDDVTVTVCDKDEAKLAETRSLSSGKIATRSDVDFASGDSIEKAVAGADLVLGGVPGWLGYNMLASVIRAGVNISDISFMPEDFRDHDGAAKAKGVIAYEDAGVAPGATNILMMDCCSRLDEVEDATYYVGGLPCQKEPPFNYKLVFSPDDVIEEYVRPARFKKNGKVETVPALSGCQEFDFKMEGVELPRMEGFFTDGCRTMLDTIPSPNVLEYTLRYPGTMRDLEFLRSIGLFSLEPVKAGGQSVRPRDLFGALAYPMMKLRGDEKDFTYFHIRVTGKKAGKKVVHTYSLYDEKDMKSGYPSMSRTTGFTCSIVGAMILDGMLTDSGVNAPESIGKNPKAVAHVIAELAKRGVAISQETIEG